MYDKNFFARGFAAIGHYEDSLKPHERAAFVESAANQRKRDDKLKVPDWHKRDTGFSPALLKSALFRCAERGARQMFTEEAPALFYSANNDKVTYTGEELRQDDLSVMLALIKLASGQNVYAELLLTPRTFIRETLGWPDNGQSVAKLDKCLRRLKKASVHIYYASGGDGTLSFVSDHEMLANGWKVWLAPRLLGLFAKQTTYLNVDDRRGLVGLNAWLFGFINADPCSTPFKLEDLQVWSGSAKVQKEFNRDLRDSLQALQDSGLISEFDVGRKTVTIKRTPRQ